LRGQRVAREFVEAKATVEGRLISIRVVEFPIIEDIALQFIKEAALARIDQVLLRAESPVGRPVKDFIIKSNVVGA